MGWYYNKISTPVSADGFRFPPRVWTHVPLDAEGSAGLVALAAKNILGWRPEAVPAEEAPQPEVCGSEAPLPAVEAPRVLVEELPVEPPAEPAEATSSESLVARRRRGSHG